MKKIFITIIISAVITSLYAQDSTAPKIPFDGIETNWQNGSDRRDSSAFKAGFFTPSAMLDINYTHSFNNPIDHTVVGSTALARDNEIELSHLLLGGDFTYGNAHARVMMQMGTRSIVIPRND